MNSANRTKNNRLAAQSSTRSVTRMPNGHLELTWDCMVLHLRTKDLLILQDTLQSWGEDPTREWAQSYCLRVNENAIILVYDDLIALCALIEDACDHVARCPIYWADLRVDIVPCSGNAWLESYRLN